MPSDGSVPDEREIEAVARAWWPNHWPNVPNPEGERQRARVAIDELYRLRDARRDEEGAGTREVLRRGLLRIASGPDDTARKWAYEALTAAARSPQAEDHEAGIDAALANVRAAMNPKIPGHLGLLRDAEAMLADLLLSPSPERDTVRLREAGNALADAVADIVIDASEDVLLVLVKRWRDVLAEFSDVPARDARSDTVAVGHNAYVQPLDGGHRGYQARCWTCEWRGPKHLRGPERLDSPEGRAHKRAARDDAKQHRAEFPRPGADEP